MAGQFSALIPLGLLVIFTVLGVFGGLSYEWYNFGGTWQGWVMFGSLFVSFAIFLNVFKRMLQRYTGRLVFALFVIAVLGAYFAYLVHVPVQKTVTVMKDDPKDPTKKIAVQQTYTDYDNDYPMGIDLAGGSELIYVLNYDQTNRNIAQTQAMIEAERVIDSKSDRYRNLVNQLQSQEDSKRAAPDRAAEVVRHRVDPNGTKGIPVTTFGNNRERLRIQLPHASTEEVKRIEHAIDTQGRLEFHICTDDRETTEATRNSKDKDIRGNPVWTDKRGTTWEEMQIKTPKKFSKNPNDFTSDPIVINRVEDMNGAHITQALSKLGQDGRWEIEVRFDASGSVEFSLLTKANIKKRMAIILDNEAKSAPTIQSQIDGVCQITGNFTKDEADKLAAVLTAGSLPAEVKLESELSVGPSLGAEQIQSGVLATVIATLIVVVFMLFYYRLAGAIAALCMLLNLPMLLGLMGFFKATLTLPGIAGIVLTLGMAVDANVLIIERLREEIARGRSMRQAVQHGFERAFLTIIDCHMTTLISSMVLYYLGTGPVRGFAVSLSLGILTTLFCNLWLNWIITEWLVAREAVTSFHLMQFFRESHIDFMGNRKLWMTLTGGLALISLVLFVYFTSPLSSVSQSVYDVDFTGGTLVQFNFAAKHMHTDKEVKDAVAKTVEPTLSAKVTDVMTKLKAASSALKVDMKERDVAQALTPALPDTGEAIAKEIFARSPTTKDGKSIDIPAGAESSIKDLEQIGGNLKKGGELTAQAYGQPDKAGKSVSFTVTSRIVNNIVTSELGSVLRSTFPGELEPDPVELKDGILTMRFSDTAQTQESLNQRLRTALNDYTKDPANAELKNDLNALTVKSVSVNNDTGVLEATIAGLPEPAKGPDGKPLAVEVSKDARIVQALGLVAIPGRIGGPISRTTAFGAQVASETGLYSLLALIVANLFVFVYLWFRFEFSGAWGFGAIVALIHDVVIAAGAVIIAHALGFPILMNLNIVAALLTITGFSVNDTIVVFDRIREVKAAHPTRSYEDIVNEACNATLSRTILTSLTVLLSVVSLLIFGGPTIKDMAFTLLIGFTVGTYSSIFIASPLMIWWYRKFGSGRAPVPTISRRIDTQVSEKNAQI